MASTRQHALAMLPLTVLVVCGAGSKTLTESSAKGMLIDQLKARGDTLTLPLNAISAQIQAPTREDYLQGVYGDSDPRASVQRLVKVGFISQSREDVKLINVSGTYTANPPGCGTGFVTIGKRSYTFTLSMQPTEAAVSGNYTFESWYGNGQRAGQGRGPVRGEVRPDGVVTLIYGPMFTHTNYTVKSDGQNISLTGPALFVCNTNMTASGTGPGGYITVPKYTYAYTEKLKQSLDASGALKAGTIKITTVTNLLLETDTLARAQYGMHIDLNTAGAAVIGKPTMSQEEHVVFRKRPDGTWVLPAN